MKFSKCALASQGSPRPFLDRRGFLSLGLKGLAALSLGQLLKSPTLARAQGGLPNIIYVVIDTVRADHTSFMGYGRPTTPNLDVLASQSCVFTRALSPSNWTLPSFASLLNGKIALHHDFHNPYANNILQETIAGALAGQGYRTVSLQTNPIVLRLDGDFQDRYHLNEAGDEKSIDGLAIAQALNWLQDNGQASPFFMFMGLFCPHQKYYPHQESILGFMQDSNFMRAPLISIEASPQPLPEAFQIGSDDMPEEVVNFFGQPKEGDHYKDARVYTASYDSEINYSDQQIGQLFAALQSQGLYDSSLIVVTADHGEMMAQGSAFFSHGQDFMYDQIHVPLLIKLPFQSQPQVINNWVSNLGVAPTILEYLGADRSGQEGVSLLPLLNGKGGEWSPGDITAYAETFDSEGRGIRTLHQFALLKSGYKFTKTVMDFGADRGQIAYTLNNMETDPQETYDLTSSQEKLFSQLKTYVTANYPGV